MTDDKKLSFKEFADRTRDHDLGWKDDDVRPSRRKPRRDKSHLSWGDDDVRHLSSPPRPRLKEDQDLGWGSLKSAWPTHSPARHPLGWLSTSGRVWREKEPRQHFFSVDDEHEKVETTRMPSKELDHQAEHLEYLRGLDAGHEEEVSFYKGGSSAFNRRFRGGYDPETGLVDFRRAWREESAKKYDPEDVKAMRRKTRLMEEVCALPTKEPLELWRGCTGMYSRLPPGHEFVDDGFTGTSLQPSTAEAFSADRVQVGRRGYPTIAKIHAPAGTLAHYLDHPQRGTGYDEEQEVLLHRGTRFRVQRHSLGFKDDAEYGPFYHVTHMEVLGHEPALIAGTDAAIHSFKGWDPSYKPPKRMTKQEKREASVDDQSPGKLAVKRTLPPPPPGIETTLNAHGFRKYESDSYSESSAAYHSIKKMFVNELPGSPLHHDLLSHGLSHLGKGWYGDEKQSVEINTYGAYHHKKKGLTPGQLHLNKVLTGHGFAMYGVGGKEVSYEGPGHSPSSPLHKALLDMNFEYHRSHYFQYSHPDMGTLEVQKGGYATHYPHYQKLPDPPAKGSIAHILGTHGYIPQHPAGGQQIYQNADQVPGLSDTLARQGFTSTGADKDKGVLHFEHPVHGTLKMAAVPTPSTITHVPTGPDKIRMLITGYGGKETGGDDHHRQYTLNTHHYAGNYLHTVLVNTHSFEHFKMDRHYMYYHPKDGTVKINGTSVEHDFSDEGKVAPRPVRKKMKAHSSLEKDIHAHFNDVEVQPDKVVFKSPKTGNIDSFHDTLTVDHGFTHHPSTNPTTWKQYGHPTKGTVFTHELGTGYWKKS
jgi:hypothetical protein